MEHAELVDELADEERVELAELVDDLHGIADRCGHRWLSASTVHTAALMSPWSS